MAAFDCSPSNESSADVRCSLVLSNSGEANQPPDRSEAVSGGDGSERAALAACAEILDVPADAQAVVVALTEADPSHAHKLKALFEQGEACAFETRGARGGVLVEGRAAGTRAWLRLAAAAADETGLPDAQRFAAFMDGLVEPAWISGADGAPVWGNAAYLRVVGVETAADAARDNKSIDRAADALAVEAAKAGELRELVRWVPLDGRRRALRFSAQPLEGGGVGVFSSDVTEVEDMRDALKKHVAAHDETLNHIADGVAIQTRPNKR